MPHTAKTAIPPRSVLFVSSEVYPYAKTGGLADVSSALPQALREFNHDVRVILILLDIANIKKQADGPSCESISDIVKGRLFR